MMHAVGKQRIKVLDVFPLPGRALLLLELDAPAPVVGLNAGMTVELQLPDGRHRQAVVKSLGFLSSTPDHAHIVVTAGTDGPEIIQYLGFIPTTAEVSEPH